MSALPPWIVGDIRSIPNDKDATQWELEPLTGIQSIEVPRYDLEVRTPFVYVSNRDCQVKDIVHHARLKQIFEKLVVDHTSASLNLDNKSTCLMV